MAKTYWKVILYHRGAEGGGSFNSASKKIALKSIYEEDFSNVNSSTFAFSNKKTAEALRRSLDKQNKEGTFNTQKIRIVPVMAISKKDLVKKIEHEKYLREKAMLKSMGIPY